MQAVPPLDIFPTLCALCANGGLRLKARMYQRWYGSPFLAVAQYVPSGRVVDVGCGFGMLAAVLALRDPARQVYGIDVDAGKIARAQRYFGSLPNVRFVEGDLAETTLPDADAIVIYDVLHHLRDTLVDRVLAQARARLGPKGRLVIKENDIEPPWKYRVSQAVEWVALGAGVTASDPVRFRSRQDWCLALEQAGFSVIHAEHLYAKEGFFVPHSLFIAEPR